MDTFRPLFQALAPLFATTWWPRVRALFVLCHLVAVCAVACPAPVRTFDAKSWARASVQEELRGWSTRLGQVGITATPQELQTFSSTVSTQWREQRAVVVAPFKWWLTTVGAPQGWYMFTGPDREPQRFALAVTTTNASAVNPPSTFSPVFELGRDGGDPSLLDPAFVGDHRVRRALFQSSWSHNDNIMRSICAWFDADLRRRRDDIADVRCTLVARAVEHPWRRELSGRVDRIVREIVRHKDGSVTETRENGTSSTKPKPGPSKSLQPKPSSTTRRSTP